MIIFIIIFIIIINTINIYKQNESNNKHIKTIVVQCHFYFISIKPSLLKYSKWLKYITVFLSQRLYS